MEGRGLDIPLVQSPSELDVAVHNRSRDLRPSRQGGLRTCPAATNMLQYLRRSVLEFEQGLREKL